MGLEIVGSTINGLRGEGIIKNYEDLTSAPARWTQTGDTPVYSAGGANVDHGEEVIFTYDSTIKDFISASFIGLTQTSSGKKSILTLTLGSESKSLEIVAHTGASEGGGSIIAMRVGDTWYYILSGSYTRANGSTGLIKTTGTFTTTGPQVPVVTVTVDTAAGGTGYGQVTRLMYA